MLLRKQLVTMAHTSGMVAWQLVTVSPGCMARHVQSTKNCA
jgi:hypothetical protein